MTAAAKSKAAAAALRERLEAVEAARRAEAEVATHRGSAIRRADEAEGRLRSVYAEARGTEPDAAEVEDARRALDAARAAAASPEWEGRAKGTTDAVLEAEREVEEFAREHRRALIAELVPPSIEVGERLAAAWTELLDADEAERAVAREWRIVSRALGTEGPPPSPVGALLRGLNDPDLRPGPTPWAPIPVGLVPEGEL